LKAVFCVGILDFEFEEDKENVDEVVHTVQLKNQHNQVFYDKLKYVYLEMPNFKKAEKDLTTRLDKWLYFIKHLEDFQNIPELFKDEIFIQAFEIAEIANYTEQERTEYEQSLKLFRDYNNTLDTAFDEGKIEGKLEGEAIGENRKANKVAKILKDNGVNFEIISNSTGLSMEEIENL